MSCLGLLFELDDLEYSINYKNFTNSICIRNRFVLKVMGLRTESVVCHTGDINLFNTNREIYFLKM